MQRHIALEDIWCPSAPEVFGTTPTHASLLMHHTPWPRMDLACCSTQQGVADAGMLLTNFAASGLTLSGNSTVLIGCTVV